MTRSAKPPKKCEKLSAAEESSISSFYFSTQLYGKHITELRSIIQNKCELFFLFGKRTLYFYFNNNTGAQIFSI